jgi:prepilin-type N-terminal cleavage/methylation domain-containing protein/prepilin-type processing-associated H-X9-DG protein
MARGKVMGGQGKSIIVSGRRGFTLVELLVVIAIIAILMAILMPSLQRVRRQAKDIVCRSNMKQWAVAVATYTVDYEDQMWLDSYWDGVGNAIPGDWMAILRPYYQDVHKIRCCPIARSPNQDTNPERRGSITTVWGRSGDVTERSRGGYWGSYGLNRWATNPAKTGGENDWFWRVSAVRHADEVPVILDCIHWHLHPEHGNRIPTQPLVVCTDFPVDGGGGTQMWRSFVDRHNSAINSSFLDGSARKVRLWELWDLRWHREFVKQHYPRERFPFLK